MLLQMSANTNELLVMASSGEGRLILVEAATGGEIATRFALVSQAEMPQQKGKQKHYLLICLIQQSSMSVSPLVVVHRNTIQDSST